MREGPATRRLSLEEEQRAQRHREEGGRETVMRPQAKGHSGFLGTTRKSERSWKSEVGSEKLAHVCVRGPSICASESCPDPITLQVVPALPPWESSLLSTKCVTRLVKSFLQGRHPGGKPLGPWPATLPLSDTKLGQGFSYCPLS